ncbi:hypothetical protein CEUSTIGMA_g8356.t1 [Chlamydomonas eustigma]|uniref:FAS1 domain-containing protein n=1 Tax=Chlamydomonas eustigma TaxID=1157962 RepID=A0A250XCW6_9CHLO|nr:hypothetical protein CEUSTIGMA_g8356.t1 [Chlamydomonas eustigma]|eukprot:GAX80921.1 hypothetical protein CEUSTIGMA_g8356.t1 [Chlamydomonas eustigma]
MWQNSLLIPTYSPPENFFIHLSTSTGSMIIRRQIAALLLYHYAVHQTHASRDPDQPPNPLACACSDVDPRDDFTKVNVTYSCWEQSGFLGVCNQSFMLATPEEVPEGYCQISCGRCACCSTFAEVLTSKAPMFLWMLNLTSFGPLITRPGYYATLLAPTDSAVWNMLKQKGYTRQQAEHDPSWVSNIVRMHVLPPTADISAVWTTPFMQKSAKLYHSIDGGYIGAETYNGGVLLSGPKSKAWITELDIPVCKGYIDIIDNVILPA